MGAAAISMVMLMVVMAFSAATVSKPSSDASRTCSDCRQSIRGAARVCGHCGNVLHFR